MDANLLAESLVHADLRGIHSHGVLRIPDYVKKLTKDGVNPRGRPRIVSERAATIVIDGGNSMGQIGGAFAMKRVIKKARGLGLALAAVRGSNHCGAMDWYTLMATRTDMIGLAGTNALPTMAPWGGTEKIVGINPLIIESLDQNKFIPVIAPVGVGRDGETYNINADLVAGEVAEALHAEKLILMTDVEGVKDKKGNLLSTLKENQARKMIQDGVVGSGMIPKVECCINALKGGVEKTHIIDGRVKHAVLLEIFTREGVGTEVVRK